MGCIKPPAAATLWTVRAAPPPQQRPKGAFTSWKTAVRTAVPIARTRPLTVPAARPPTAQPTSTSTPTSTPRVPMTRAPRTPPTQAKPAALHHWFPVWKAAGFRILISGQGQTVATAPQTAGAHAPVVRSGTAIPTGTRSRWRHGIPPGRRAWQRWPCWRCGRA